MCASFSPALQKPRNLNLNYKYFQSGVETLYRAFNMHSAYGSIILDALIKIYISFLGIKTLLGGGGGVYRAHAKISSSTFRDEATFIPGTQSD